jgi:hypothetical protein
LWRSWKRAINVAEQVVAAEKRKKLCPPKKIVLRSEHDGDVIGEQKRR